MTAAQTSPQCHPSGLPPVIRPGHPEDGTAYSLTTGGSEFGRTWQLADAHGVARNASRIGDACHVVHVHSDGTSCLVATYRYGKVA